MLEEAIQYGRLGWKVFPMNRRSPALIDWQERATSDPVGILKLFEVPYRMGIGLVTGEKNGLTVVDVKDSRNGFRTMDELGIYDIQFQKTPCFNNRTGGRRYFFKYCLEAVSGTEVFGRDTGIDILNDGTFSFLPLSIHPENGRSIKWIPGQGPAEVDVAPFPLTFLAVYLQPYNWWRH